MINSLKCGKITKLSLKLLESKMCVELLILHSLCGTVCVVKMCVVKMCVCVAQCVCLCDLFVPCFQKSVVLFKMMGNLIEDTWYYIQIKTQTISVES